MHLHIPRVVTTPVILASAHALRDFRRPPLPLLLSYAVALVPYPFATPSFLLASVRHFANDVGMRTSMLLHAWWIGLAHLHLQSVAWVTFVLYYVFVHAMPCLLQWLTTAPMEACVALVFCAACAVIHDGSFVVNDVLQRVVVSHVMLGESTRKQITRCSNYPTEDSPCTRTPLLQ